MSHPRQSELRSLWGDLERGGGGGREFRAIRLRSSAPIALYAALREGDKAHSLVFEAPIGVAPRARTSFPGEGISLGEERNPAEGVYRLATSLEGAAFVGPFEALCLDLIDVAESEVSAVDALAALVRRMATWMASLRRRGGLTDEAVRGLFGELCCLVTAAEAVGWEAAVTGWMGPDDGIHDLVCGGAGWEVKTTLGPGSSLWINGLDQLDDSGLTALFLVHLGLTLDAAGKSLKDLSLEIREAILTNAPAATAEFERKLLAAGFVGLEPAAEVAFRVSARSHFRVSDTFPRILRSEVGPGIAEARYQIHLAALQAHGVDADEALAAFTPVGGHK